tara:strand:+ start:131430 stop:131597 length:168 start_codon:yes stop_codon:yes gene_type:complete
LAQNFTLKMAKIQKGAKPYQSPIKALSKPYQSRIKVGYKTTPFLAQVFTLKMIKI